MQLQGKPLAKTGHIPTLDGLRGIAVLLVLWFHIPKDLPPYFVNLAAFLVKPGYLGVDIFFVLSGFLITRILISERNRGLPLRLFMMRRFLRIFPIYYLLLAFFLVVAPSWDLFWCAIYLSNFYFAFDPHPSPLHHTWSLAIEEQFYLLWPLLVYFVPLHLTKRLIWWVFFPLPVVTAVVISFLADADRAIQLSFLLTPCRTLSLSAGAAIAFYETYLRDHPSRLGRYALIFFVAAAVTLAIGLTLPRQWVPLPRLVGFSMLSTSIVLSAILIGDIGSRLAVVLVGLPLSYIGRISYGLYLYHYPLYKWVFREVADEHYMVRVLGAVGAVALSFAVAMASYHVIERPLLRLKDRFHGSRPAQTGADISQPSSPPTSG